MIQLKLFELFNPNDGTAENLLGIFGKEDVIKFSDKYIGIAYDYDKSTYVDILRKTKELNLRQVIVTSRTFFELVNYSIKHDFTLNEIKFVYPIADESVEFVNRYLQEINALVGEEKNNYKQQLFEELDWIVSDECIDIKVLSLHAKFPESPLYIKIELYNNGVLLINSRKILGTMIDMIKQIFGE
ncbi:hypothetical protein FT641_15895 [Bacillus paranthracis]|uniref:hypothetical protein n=1 Tax=Bacillus paranthracis TaxID=2026186 RepID=UPI0018797EB6|nr:hypothetical protein [Bacillus paranthracis]MBE7114030.1 hypothetical protein [Bacillus paranthracis]MBE7133214.1 hypothetical protein [Bacillus paranthracis]MBE7154168.1 hypothetical protein [Bacillus paranthracis]MDK7539123.1 hypothetical protein [Bacillus paranthracis]MDK7562908.1 hypothetical protein [Bacillus paranthracis]